MLAAAPAEGTSAAAVTAAAAVDDDNKVIIVPSTDIAAPAVASPPALATSTCPKLLAGARNDEVDGDAENGVGDVARSHFGSSPADDHGVREEPAKLGTRAPSVA